MTIRLLKIMLVLCTLVVTAQGCAIWVGDGDDFHHYRGEHGEHHGHGEHER